MSKSGKKEEETRLTGPGTWTVMGIVKRLDDQKRMVELVRDELEQMKSRQAISASADGQLQRLNILAQNVETALAANKKLTDSVIRIREAISSLTKENERLREEITMMKLGPRITATYARRTSWLSDANLAVIRSFSKGPMSSTEASRALGRSREHTSRMVKKLVDLGLLEASQKNPPRYVLARLGREILGGYEVTSG